MRGILSHAVSGSADEMLGREYVRQLRVRVARGGPSEFEASPVSHALEPEARA